MPGEEWNATATPKTAMAAPNWNLFIEPSRFQRRNPHRAAAMSEFLRQY
jgi:hypothetical protein